MRVIVCLFLRSLTVIFVVDCWTNTELFRSNTNIFLACTRQMIINTFRLCSDLPTNILLYSIFNEYILHAAC